MSLQVWAKNLPCHAELLSAREAKVLDAQQSLDTALQSRDVALLMRALKKTEVLRKSAVLLSPQETAWFVERAMQATAANNDNQDAALSWIVPSCAARAIALTASLLQPRTPALVPLVQHLVSWPKLARLVQQLHDTPTDTDYSTANEASDDIVRSHSDALAGLLRVARYYQPQGTADEVWQRYRGSLQTVNSPDLHEDQLHLYLFYPGGSQQQQDSAQDTLEQWMDAWGLVDNNPVWDCAWFGLVRRLLKANAASSSIQVEHHLCRLFGRFLANLKLNGETPSINAGSIGSANGSQRKFSPWQQAMSGSVRFQKAAKLLVQVLHVGDCVKRLEYFCLTVHTFMHPSNHGSHADRLTSFLSFLCEAFAKRIGQAPQSLARDVKKRFIASVYPLVEMGLYSKSLGVIAGCQSALRHLSWLAPVTMARLTLPVVREGLDPSNVTRPHQAAAGMKILTATVQSLVFGSPSSRSVILPELCDFLENSLPGLDPNDSRKTAVTLLMSYSVMSCVPLVGSEHFEASVTAKTADCSSVFGIDDEDDGMEVDQPRLAFGSRLEDWALAFFRRLFTLAQSRGQRAKKGASAQMDNILDFFLKETIALGFSQLANTERRQEAMRAIVSFLVDESALPEAHREAGSFAFGLVRCNPQAALAALVPALVLRVEAKADSKQVEWALVVLGAAVRFGGHFLLPHAESVKQAISRSFQHKDSNVRYLGAKLLRRLARGLLATYPFLNQNSSSLGKEELFRPTYDVNNNQIDVKWHLPNEQEVAFASAMLGEFKRTAFGFLHEPSSSSSFQMDASVTDKERINHHLVVVFQCIRGGLTHFNRGAPEQELEQQSLIQCAHELQNSSNIHGLKLCIKSLVLLASKSQGPKGGGNESYLFTYKAWTAWLREVSQNRAVESQIKQQAREAFYARGEGTGTPEDASVYLTHMLLSDYEFLNEREVYLASFERGLVNKDNIQLASEAVLGLCFHPFSAVRKCAQTHLEFVDVRCRFAFREQIVDKVIPKLAAGTAEEFTGAIYLLRHGSALRRINLYLPAFRAFLLTALKQQGDDSTSINTLRHLPDFRQAKAQERLARLVGSVLTRWQRFSQRNASPEAAAQFEREAGELCVELVHLARNNSGDWRTQLTVLTVIAVLVPRTATEEGDVVSRFVLDMCRHEMLPTRLGALFVLRRLLLAGEEQQGVARLLSSFTQQQATEFWVSTGTTLGLDRSNGGGGAGGGGGEVDQWSAGVGDNIKLVKTLVRRPKFPRLSSNMLSRDFHTSKVDLMVAFCQHMPPASSGGVSLLPALRELATEGESSKDRAERRLSACEMFAAVLRVRPQECTREFVPVLLRMLAELPSASNWCDAASYVACYAEDHGALLYAEVERELVRKTASLATSTADGEPETEGEQERGFSYTCNLVKVLGSMLEERRQPVPPALVGRLDQLLVHPYKAVRQAAATSFAILRLRSSSRSSGSEDDDDDSLVQTMLRCAKDGGKEGQESALCFVAVLVSIAPTKMVLGPIVLPLLGPVVFDAQGHSEVELALLAKSVLGLCSVSLKCFAVPDTKLVVEFERKLIADYAQHSEWTKRRALCAFLRSFHALHGTFLLGMGAGALVQKTSEELLMDTQAEVREAARLLLLSLLVAVPESSLVSAKDRYCRMLQNPQQSKKKQQQGILALTALVETSPYSVPAALPPTLAVLAGHVNHPLLGQQVKKTLSEFRRTHIDEWAEHKLRFTEDELNALEGVLFSPDYYA